MTSAQTAAAWAAALGIVAAAWAADPLGTAEDLAGKKAGETFVLGGRTVTVKSMEVLPLVNNEFSKRFAFDAFAEETLKKLRQQEKLDEVVAPGKTEFEKQVLLLDWAFKRIKKFGPPKSNPIDPLEICKRVDAGEAFNCSYYERLLRAALQSMGYVARSLGLKGAKSDGNGSEHSLVEVWSNQYRKWVLLDPTLDLYFLKGERPLNGYELRQEWFYKDKGKDLTIVIGAAGEKHTVKDMPIACGTHAGFGTLSLNENSLGKFLYLAYTPAASNGAPDYGKMFITKDALCEGVSYHTRDNPKDPAADPYWPMQQAALGLTAGPGTTIAVKAQTNTPDFAKFQCRLNNGPWTDGVPERWALQAGDNTLEVQSVNQFGIAGAISKVVLSLAS